MQKYFINNKTMKKKQMLTGKVHLIAGVVMLLVAGEQFQKCQRAI